MLLWVMGIDGVIASREFGTWVSLQDAIESLREQYPHGLAILDTKDNTLVWKLDGVELA
jgi:hypothetical protein